MPLKAVPAAQVLAATVMTLGSLNTQSNISMAKSSKQLIKYIPNRLTFLYFKIYYKEENYLKVKTAVFKYITLFIVKVKYISMLVY